MLEIIIAALMICAAARLSWFVLRVFGWIMGAILSVVGFIFAGVLMLTIGLPFLAMPALAVVGLISLIRGRERLTA